MAKIAQNDAIAMNSLFAGELVRVGGKTAAGAESPTGPEAFTDHKDYEATLANVLADDKKESWSPNDMILD
jgi:hypothetical protein